MIIEVSNRMFLFTKLGTQTSVYIAHFTYNVLPVTL